jgi:hypothetical protein
MRGLPAKRECDCDTACALSGGAVQCCMLLLAIVSSRKLPLLALNTAKKHPSPSPKSRLSYFSGLLSGLVACIGSPNEVFLDG